MSRPLRLVIFDVDGTLVDSQGDIVAAMTAAFAAVDAPVPSRTEVLSIVGLSLDVAMTVLAPARSSGDHLRMVKAYKDAYMTLRAEAGVAQSSPLYSGALDTLRKLHAKPEVLLGVATGKSKRGLDKLIAGHGLEGLFVTQQVADFHPSKPHPSMIHQAMADAGVGPEATVMIGDTSFDMDMAAAAGVTGIGVKWGYHSADKLVAATHLVESYAALPALLEQIWSIPA
jgi:phosphoglycolate phosphatase